jgi:hypothetical protein
MKRNELWNEIRRMNGLTLRTLDRRKPFDIIAVSNNAITVMPLSSGKECPIPRAGIEDAF